MKCKVNELEGALLDAAVAMAAGEAMSVYDVSPPSYYGMFPYSSDWVHGGKIIEREQITLVAFEGIDGKEPLLWWAHVGAFTHYIDESLPGYQYDRCANNPLVAAMRAYVSSRFGKEVELP